MQYPGPRLTVVKINKALLFLDLEGGYTQELITALKTSHLHIRTLRFYYKMFPIISGKKLSDVI